MKSVIIKVGLILIVVFIICVKIDYVDSLIINPDNIFSISIDVLGTSLAVTAIFFTVVDRYKEKSQKKKEIEIQCLPILREMCQNVMGICIVTFLMFVVSIFEPIFPQIVIEKCSIQVNVVIYLFLSGFILILVTLLDIIRSILALTQGLFLSQDIQEEDNDKYSDFLIECKKLDKKHFSELIEYTKTLIVKQTLEKED